MEVHVAVLADAANVAPPGKLNMLGVFDTIHASSFPALHPAMALVLRLKVSYEDANSSHRLSVKFQDEDGKQIGGAQSMVTVKEVEAGKFGHVNQILNFAGVRFAKPGHYVFQVFWDDALKTQIDLLVVKREA